MVGVSALARGADAGLVGHVAGIGLGGGPTGVVEPQQVGGALAGQVGLVTGASSGLGRATAVALARAGAEVALLACGRTDLICPCSAA